MEDGLTTSTVLRDEPHLSRCQVHRVTKHDRPVKSKADECGGLYPLQCLSHADIASGCGGWLKLSRFVHTPLFSSSCGPPLESVSSKPACFEGRTRAVWLCRWWERQFGPCDEVHRDQSKKSHARFICERRQYRSVFHRLAVCIRRTQRAHRSSRPRVLWR